MQIEEHESEFGRWQVAQRAADPRLRAYVRGYFASSSFLPTGLRERHLPSVEVPLVVNFGAPHRREGAVNGAWRDHDGAWVVGLHDGPQLYEAFGERHFMIALFTPIGAHLFLGLPMHLLAAQAVDLGQINPTLAHLVMSRVGVAASWDERFAAMEALIAERVKEATLPGEIAWAWKKLSDADGRIALGSLASEIDCSHRQLIAQFQRCIGLPPKTIARLLRFNRAVRLMNRRTYNRPDQPSGKPYIEAPVSSKSSRLARVAWADLAADCGYFDQPHFIKEFGQFAGTSPSSFLKQVTDVD